METTQQVLKVLIPIFVGVALRAAGLFRERDGVLVRHLVIRFTLPLFVFFSIYGAGSESLAAMGGMMLAFGLMSVGMFGVGWLATGLFRGPEQRTAVHACATFGNYGWIALGVAGVMFGEAGTQRVLYFILFWWPVFYAFGLLIGLIHTREGRSGMPLGRVAAMAVPTLGALALGLGANLSSVRVPALVVDSFESFGQMTVPLILLSVGMTLDFRRIRAAVWPAVLVSVLVLAVGPLLGWAIAAAVAGDPISYKTIIIEGAMPVALMTPLLEECYPMDQDVVGASIVLSTALSVVTIPLVVTLVSA